MLKIQIKRLQTNQIRNLNINNNTENSSLQRYQMFKTKIQSSRANGNTNINGYPNDSNGFNTDRFKHEDSRQINSNISQRKTFTSGQFTTFKKVQPPKNTELIIRQCDPSELNTRKNVARQSQELNPTYQFISSKKDMIQIGSRKKYDSNAKEPMVQIHYSDRQNSQSRRSSQFQANSSIQVLTEEIFHLKEHIKLNFNKFNSQIYQNSIDCKKTVKMVNATNGSIQKMTQSINQNFTKNSKQILSIRTLCNSSKQEIQSLSQSFFAFIKDQQQKMENIVLDGSMKRSKHFDEFGVDLKSSSQCLGGMGASMSMNLGGQNLNVRLYNELSIQLQTFKSQLQDCKEKICTLQSQKKLVGQAQVKQQKPDKFNSKNSIQIYEIDKIVAQKLFQFKKSLSLKEKFGQFQKRFNELHIQIQNQESNIKGMNQEFFRVLNQVIIPRQKGLQHKVKVCEQSLRKVNEREESVIKSLVQPQIKNQIQKKLSTCIVLKVRSQNKVQEQILVDSKQSIQGSRQTYMLDQNNFLMDSRGYYLVENGNDSQTQFKKKIKIQEDLLYLLQMNGIQITTAQ